MTELRFHQGRLLDHVHLRVTDLDASKAFYAAALLADEVRRYIRRVDVKPGRGNVADRVSVLFVGEVEGDNVVTLPTVAVAA